MKKWIKNLFMVTAIISALLGIVFLLQAVFLMFNIGGYKDTFIGMIQEMGLVTNPSEINFQVNMSIFDSVIGILLNVYAAGIYFKMFKINNILVGSSRILLNIGILQCFFIISIVPGMLAIIMSFVIRKEEKTIIERPRTPQSTANDLVDRISNLKARKESGNISEEEYKKLLDAIIEQSVLDQSSAGLLKPESLKDKIATIKSESKKEDDVDK